MWTLFVRESGDLGFDQWKHTAGPHREDEELKPMMHEPEKSNSAIVAMKPANKAGKLVAEPVERRADREEHEPAKHVPGTTGKACHRRWVACDERNDTLLVAKYSW